MNIGSTIVFFGSLLILWALLNIFVYLLWGRKVETSIRKYFMQFGAVWNIVNLAIGAYAVYFGASNSAELNQLGDLAQLQVRFVALNVFLDTIYMLIGAAVYFYDSVNRSQRRAGYGLGAIAQGGFLFAFDALFVATLAAIALR
jgi:hypothetical protein